MCSITRRMNGSFAMETYSPSTPPKIAMISSIVFMARLPSDQPSGSQDRRAAVAAFPVRFYFASVFTERRSVFVFKHHSLRNFHEAAAIPLQVFIDGQKIVVFHSV